MKEAELPELTFTTDGGFFTVELNVLKRMTL
jgi:hypothetical protein